MIIKPFNKLFWLLLGIVLACVIGLGVYANNGHFESSIKILLVFQLINLVVFYIYKIYIQKDEEYAMIAQENDLDKSCFWNEMIPMHLCNIGLIFIPIAILTRNQYLLCFCCFVTPFSTIAAILMPPAGFEKYSLLKPRVLGYYFTHLVLLASSLCLWSIGLYIPSYDHLLPMLGIWFICQLASLIVNLLIRRYTDCKRVNYLYTMGSSGNPVLEYFYRLIPVPLLFHFPMTAIYMAFVTIIMFILLHTIY